MQRRGVGGWGGDDGDDVDAPATAEASRGCVQRRRLYWSAVDGACFIFIPRKQSFSKRGRASAIPRYRIDTACIWFVVAHATVACQQIGQIDPDERCITDGLIYTYVYVTLPGAQFFSKIQSIPFYLQSYNFFFWFHFFLISFSFFLFLSRLTMVITAEIDARACPCNTSKH